MLSQYARAMVTLASIARFRLLSTALGRISQKCDEVHATRQIGIPSSWRSNRWPNGNTEGASRRHVRVPPGPARGTDGRRAGVVQRSVQPARTTRLTGSPLWTIFGARGTPRSPSPACSPWWPSPGTTWRSPGAGPPYRPGRSGSRRTAGWWRRSWWPCRWPSRANRCCCSRPRWPGPTPARRVRATTAAATVRRRQVRRRICGTSNSGTRRSPRIGSWHSSVLLRRVCSRKAVPRRTRSSDSFCLSRSTTTVRVRMGSCCGAHTNRP
ncbi:hypothetical protein QFZ22_003910 [Streptomyces canus]|uniref:Secreted protein n=1 Tax=Streptomyces canus TaxID=58343 RepID=A0AAW8FFJ7_9ACTN|nr:hypothetical protein [Streptomyces canus]